MTNIPTELLRTLLAVVDVRSFTKAARLLGITQPAVSAQIKRLQALLDFDLFDKSAPGVSVTERGERVVHEARRLLAINDEIVALSRMPQGARMLRVGLPGDFVGKSLWRALAVFQTRRPEWCLHVQTASSPALLQDLHHGSLDIAVVLSAGKPQQAALYHWRDETIWVGNTPNMSQPVRLLTRGEDCIFHRAMINALESAGRPYEIAINFGHIDDLTWAATVGLGVVALPRSLAIAAGAPLCNDGALPKLSDIISSVCIRTEPPCAIRDELAGLIADALKPSPMASTLATRASLKDSVGVVAHQIPAE